MRFIGHLIARFVQILMGLIVAAIAAAVFLSVGLFRNVLAPTIEYNTDMTADGALVPIIALVASPFLAMAILAPAAFLIAIAELMRWRGIIANMGIGALVALFTGWRHIELQTGEMLSQGTILVLLATGFVGGFFYWLIAGRSAGKWLD
jgi:ABC-type uncharacterized transport system permease subunit